MKTSLKPFGMSTVKKWAAEFKRGRESGEYDEQNGRLKDATADENVKVVHNCLCVMGGET